MRKSIKVLLLIGLGALIIASYIASRINPHSLLLIIGFVISLALGIFVYLKDRKNTVNKTFLFLNLAFAVWYFDLLGLCFVPNEVFAKYWVRVFGLGLRFMPATALHFTLAFIRNLDKKRWKIIYTVYTVSLGFVILEWTGFAGGRYVKTAAQYLPGAGLGYRIFMLYFALVMGYVSWELFKKYRKSVRVLEQNRLKYFFMGAFSGIVIGAFNFLPSFGIKVYPIGNLGAIVFISVVAYAIVQYQLMDIRIIIKQATVYSTLTASVSGAYFLILLAFTTIFPETGRAIPNILFALLIVFGFQRFRDKIQKGVDRLFYREGYDYRKALRDFSESLTLRSVMKLNPLADSIINTVTGTVHIKNATLMVFKESIERFDIESSKGFRKKVIEHLFLSNDDYLVKSLKEGKILVREEVESRLEGREYARSDKEFQRLEGTRASLENLKAAISIPLINKGKLVGIVNLGEKMSQDVYSGEDLELFDTIANQAAIAVENAKLYENILTMKDYTDNILKDITSGVITIDLEGRIVTLNEHAEKITGEKLAEVVGRPCLEVYKERGELGEVLLDTLRKEEHYLSRETTLVDKEGKSVFIGVSTSLLRDSEGKKIGALAAFADLSEIKRLEEHMRRTDRLAVAGTLAAGMAHEIKNPLSSIEMFTQMLPRRFDDEKFRNKFSNIVIQELERLNNLVDALLSFARPSQPEFRLTQVNKILDRVLSLMEVKISKHSVEVIKEYDDNLPEVSADEKHLVQVFINLALNAIEAMPEGGELRIKTGIWLGKKRGRIAPSVRMHFIGPPKYKFVEIKFSDTGKGVLPESLPRLFDPFFSTKEKGTGLGLSVVHQIIEQHEGSIDVESEKGVGTTFTIRLPLEREEKKMRGGI